ncbi:hypothetical protein vseg_005198 [Gypsophila vaccaria]
MADIQLKYLKSCPILLVHSSSFHQFSVPTTQTFKFTPRRSRASSSSSSSSSSSLSAMKQRGGDERPRFKDFPYLSAPMKDLMIDLVSRVESALGSQLLPCTLPQDAQYFENSTSTAHASIFLRSASASASASSSSPIDYILGSWIHCELPSGSSINITSLLSYMNVSTDAPSLLIEFIQSSPTSVVILLDLPPRRDLVLHPDYLKTFYQDTHLDALRMLLHNIPEVQPYVSPSLYVRTLFSPTAALIRLDTTDTGGEERLAEILRGTLSDATKQVLQIWLDFCILGEPKCIQQDDQVSLKKRDSLFKQKSIEVDLGANLPRMFGQQIADRIMEVLLAT